MITTVILYGITALALIVSLILDRRKTAQALKIAWRRFEKIARPIAVLVILVAVTLTFLSDDMISSALGGKNKLTGMLAGLLIGSIAFIPGFIVFPLTGVLLAKGVPYMVLSAFTTTLMMVGVLSFPVEKSQFTTAFAVLRNLAALFIALAVAFVTGIVFGEIFP